MPPSLALALTLAFIAVLFWRDIRQRPHITGAVWLPLLWVLVIGSRFVSEWLNLGTPQSVEALEDGSPADRLFFLSLMVAAACVLFVRRLRIGDIVRNNGWLTAFLFYCLIATLWSDFPFVALKRWTKILGHPIMALVICTEPDPQEAVRRLMKRCSYILVPVSILFIKYFPQWGRGFDGWTGFAVNTGITTDKNALGYDCMVLGTFFAAHLMTTYRAAKDAVRRAELALIGGFLTMIVWLLMQADSKTSLVCLLIAVVTMAGVSLRIVNKRFIGLYLIVTVVTMAAVESVFGVYAYTIQALGRNLTLTDRTDIWREVLKIDINPLFGAGFESFWLGERLERLWRIFWFHPNQAHNGYLETYLNLGWVGVFMLAGLCISTFLKAKRDLLSDLQSGRFRLGLLLAILVYNYTEATFKAVHLVWFAFYIIALDYPKQLAAPVRQVAHPARGVPVAAGAGNRLAPLPQTRRAMAADMNRRRSLSR
jgi:exopolysaccharide production protein ExoQ